MVAKSIKQLDQQIITCHKCPRLVKWRKEISVTKRKAYQSEKYWGKPVPGFGDERAKLLILGLAPGAHGANRTGRIFTGDSSGDWLYRALYQVGIAKLPTSTSLKDGQELKKTRISCAVRCVPPGNKPNISERDNCADFLDQELQILEPGLESILVLGSFAFKSALTILLKNGYQIPKPTPTFKHGGFFIAKKGAKSLKIVSSYHPSQQNTFTGKLTEKMLRDAIKLTFNENI